MGRNARGENISLLRDPMMGEHADDPVDDQDAEVDPEAIDDQDIDVDPEAIDDQDIEVDPEAIDDDDAEVDPEAINTSDQGTNAEGFPAFQQRSFERVFAVNPVSHSPQVRVFKRAYWPSQAVRVPITGGDYEYLVSKFSEDAYPRSPELTAMADQLGRDYSSVRDWRVTSPLPRRLISSYA